jgi:hypothetical protein
MSPPHAATCSTLLSDMEVDVLTKVFDRVLANLDDDVRSD